jgi:4-amino-4-deoxy-L-arabinose transferase-like glycosyltransferase
MGFMEKMKRVSKFAVGVFFLALVLRLGVVIATREMRIGLDDMFQYDMLARSLAAGEGFRWYGEEDLALVERYFPLEFVLGDYDPRGVLTSFRPPGYPAFLAVIYKLGGLENRFFYARLAQAFLGALLAPLTFALARRTFPAKEKMAKAAAVTVAVYPMLVVYPFALATENTFIPLILGGTVTLLKAAETRRWRDYLLAGILFGIAALTRSVIVAILPFVLLWLWFLVKDRRGALVVLACVLAFTIPWSVRNTRLHGKFVFIENSMGYNLHQGYHPESDGTFKYGPSLELVPYMDDGQRDEIGRELAVQFIKDDPWRVPYLVVRKAAYFFELERRALTYFYSNNFVGYIPQPWFTLVFALFTLPFAVVISLVALGLPFLKWRQEPLLVMAVCFGYFAPHLLLLAEPRFHLALVAFLAVFAAHTWANFPTLRAQMRLKENWWKLAIAAALLALLWFNWGFELWKDLDTLIPLFGPEGNKTFYVY